MTDGDTSSREAGVRLVERLAENGVEYVFGTFGTDHPTLLKGLASSERITTIKAPHEMVAASAAHGYAQVTGRPQAVLAHVDVGTANLGASVHNAARSRVPMFIMAGRTPLTSDPEVPGSRSTFVHYYQDVYDQHSLVSEYTKWEYELEHARSVTDAADRGMEIADTPPKGPVYLTMPREVLRYESGQDSEPPGSMGRTPAFGTIGRETTADLGSMIADATEPLLVTSYLGRDEEAVDVLEKFVETTGVPVVEAPVTFDMNFPHDHPLHLGFDPSRYLADSDLVIVVNCDVPWVPARETPPDETVTVHIDPDAGKEQYPMWGFQPDRSIRADPKQALVDLTEYLESQSSRDFEERFERMAERHQELERERTERIDDAGASDRISVAGLTDAVSRGIDDDTVVVAEPVSNTPAVLEHLDRREPGTYYSYCMSGLGWGLGASLGIKLAKPDSTVVTLVADGSFTFGNPMAAIQMAQTYDLPHLLVVYNNEGWQAVDKAIEDQYGDTSFGSGDFSKFDPDHTFAEAAEGMGCHGERVTKREELPAAIENGLEAVESGSVALIDAVVDREFP